MFLLSAATPASKLLWGLSPRPDLLDAFDAGSGTFRNDPPPVLTLCPVTAAPPVERPVVPIVRDLPSDLAQLRILLRSVVTGTFEGP